MGDPATAFFAPPDRGAIGLPTLSAPYSDVEEADVPILVARYAAWVMYRSREAPWAGAGAPAPFARIGQEIQRAIYRMNAERADRAPPRGERFPADVLPYLAAFPFASGGEAGSGGGGVYIPRSKRDLALEAAGLLMSSPSPGVPMIVLPERFGELLYRLHLLVTFGNGIEYRRGGAGAYDWAAELDVAITQPLRMAGFLQSPAMLVTNPYAYDDRRIIDIDDSDNAESIDEALRRIFAEAMPSTLGHEATRVFASASVREDAGLGPDAEAFGALVREQPGLENAGEAEARRIFAEVRADETSAERMERAARARFAASYGTVVRVRGTPIADLEAHQSPPEEEDRALLNLYRLLNFDSNVRYAGPSGWYPALLKQLRSAGFEYRRSIETSDGNSAYTSVYVYQPYPKSGFLFCGGVPVPCSY